MLYILPILSALAPTLIVLRLQCGLFSTDTNATKLAEAALPPRSNNRLLRSRTTDIVTAGGTSIVGTKSVTRVWYDDSGAELAAVEMSRSSRSPSELEAGPAGEVDDDEEKRKEGGGGVEEIRSGMDVYGDLEPVKIVWKQRPASPP